MLKSILNVFFIFFIFTLLSIHSYGCTFNCGSSSVIPQKDPGGPAVKYGDRYFTIEMPETARPNDATISLYEDGYDISDIYFFFTVYFFYIFYICFNIF